MPTEEKKTGRGPKPRKREPQIQHGPLRWPVGEKRTKPEDRVRGFFKLSTQSKSKNVLDLTSEAIRVYFKRVGVLKAHVTFAFSTPQESFDSQFHEPGVAIWFQWQGGAWLKLACDKFNTAIGNLRACLEVLDGFHKSTRHDYVLHDFQVNLAPLQAFGLTRTTCSKSPVKTHLDPIMDWQAVLEIHDDELDDVTGLPTNRKLVAKKYSYLSMLYHPDHGKDPDNGASFDVVQKSAQAVRTAYRKLDTAPQAKLAAAMRAQEDAARRKVEARASKKCHVCGIVGPHPEGVCPGISKEVQKPQPKPEKPAKPKKAKAKKKVTKKKVEPKPEPAPQPEDEDQTPQESGPSEEELRNIDFDQRDDDLDDSDAVDDPNEDGYPEAPPPEKLLFDSPDAEENIEEEARDEVQERNRKIRDIFDQTGK